MNENIPLKDYMELGLYKTEERLVFSFVLKKQFGHLRYFPLNASARFLVALKRDRDTLTDKEMCILRELGWPVEVEADDRN